MSRSAPTSLSPYHILLCLALLQSISSLMLPGLKSLSIVHEPTFDRERASLLSELGTTQGSLGDCSYVGFPDPAKRVLTNSTTGKSLF